MQFRSAAESDSGSAKAHWGLARTFENLGQFNEVLDELRKTVELDDTNLEAKAKLGNYFLLVKPPMIAETEKIRDEILAKNPTFIEGHILTASIMAAQSKPDAEVVSAVKKAIALDPKRIESYVSLERLYMTREKAPEAEAAIQNGIAANPASAIGYTEYGRLLMYSTRDAEAETQFQKGIDIDLSNIEARESLADFYMTSRQFAKAEGVYLDLVQVQENSPESRLELAGYYDKADRKDEAVSTLKQIINDVPEYALARYQIGQMFLDRRDIASVNEQLDALFKINNNDTEALMLRSRVRLQENKGEDAIKDLEEVLKKTPSAKEALFLIAEAKLTVGQIDPANAFISDIEKYHPTYLRVGLLKIQSAFASSEPQNVLKLSNQLIEKTNAATPNAETDSLALRDLRIRGLSSRGLAYLYLGKLSEARADLQEIVRLSPRSSSALVNLAKVSVAENNYPAALDLYEKALAADRQNFDAVSGVVDACIRTNQMARAHAKIDELIAANFGKNEIVAAFHYLRSTIFKSEKNIPSAEKELTAAIEIDENYLPAYSAYADLLAGQNRSDEAIIQYKKALDRRASAQNYTLLGILEDARGNAAEAEKAYRKALQIAPEMSIAANNLAWLIADHQGNLDEALRLATVAVSKNQSVAGYYDTLGWIYLEKGLVYPAVEQLKKAVALDEAATKKSGGAPNPDYRTRLGMALAKAGDKITAKREVETSFKSANALTQREALTRS